MIRRHHGVDIPVEIYHGVPKGWYAHEIVAQHIALRGTFSIETPEPREPGAPSWMPERKAWLYYRATMYRLADGVRAGDAACAELAIRYIELNYIGSYSGFIRSKLARSLVNAALDARQKRRLNDHFYELVVTSRYSEEFANYIRVWRRTITDKMLTDLKSHGDNKAKNSQVKLAELIAKLERP
jgi:hypothetical protein